MQKKVLVIGYREFEIGSQRGINILSETFLDLGFKVDRFSYPIYFWNVLKKNNKKLFKVGKGILSNKKLFVFLPYSAKRFKNIKKSSFNKIFEFFHVNTIPKIDFDKYDIVVLESGKEVFFSKRFNHENLVYRMSDSVAYDLAPGLAEYEFELIRKAKLVIVPNEKLRNKYIEELRLYSSKIVVWENGFRIPEDEFLFNPFEENKSVRNIVYMGLFPINWELILYACERLKNANFHIIGPHKIPKKINLPENLKVYGYLPHSKAVSFIKYGDIFILPYIDKPEKLRLTQLTSKIMLVMSLKKPIVTSNFTNADFLERYGIIVSKNKESFVKNIKDLLINNVKEKNYNIDLSRYEVTQRKKELINILKKFEII